MSDAQHRLDDPRWNPNQSSLTDYEEDKDDDL